MTTLEASIKLFDWFKENDYYVYPSDNQKLLVISENDLDHLPIKKALSNFSAQEMLSCEVDELGKVIYFLNRRLDQVEQNLEIDGYLASAIGTKINWFCNDVLKDTADICDPSSISKKDVWNLLHIIEIMKKELDKATASE
jgi:hypothetical protein